MLTACGYPWTSPLRLHRCARLLSQKTSRFPCVRQVAMEMEHFLQKWLGVTDPDSPGPSPLVASAKRQRCPPFTIQAPCSSYVLSRLSLHAFQGRRCCRMARAHAPQGRALQYQHVRRCCHHTPTSRSCTSILRAQKRAPRAQKPRILWLKWPKPLDFRLIVLGGHKSRSVACACLLLPRCLLHRCTGFMVTWGQGNGPRSSVLNRWF